MMKPCTEFAVNSWECEAQAAVCAVCCGLEQMLEKLRVFYSMGEPAAK